MKEISMRLKEVPPNFYKCQQETIHCISPKKVYMVKSFVTRKNIETPFEIVKYFFRLSSRNNVYEALITENLYENILCDSLVTETNYQSIFEYLWGRDTVRVIVEADSSSENIVAIGPEDNKEWQYEFQKYHI